MRIVQTFWTAGRDPLKYSFGWAHPEYNLMSWALSCLSLREHYDEVALYTDQEGYDVLINKLHLPYTEENVVYDKNLCLPHHWAYAKIKTYSMQTKPFLHVDGDVYLPKPIPEEIINAPLIAQNREIGTEYYRSMIERMLSYPEIVLPDFVQQGLAEQSVASYNMGLFGGSDLDFIKRYCQEVENFMNINNMNDSSERVSRLNCNVIFEQILFAVFADNERREVTCLLERPMQDKGYTAGEFCDFWHFKEQSFLHILGGHKRIQEVFRELEHTLLHRYQEYAMRIMSLYSLRYPRLFGLPIKLEHKERYAKKYQTYIAFIEEVGEKWSVLSGKDILDQEKKNVAYYEFLNATKEEQKSFVLCSNPYMNCFETPRKWGKKNILLREEIGNLTYEGGNCQIFIIPDIHSEGHRVVLVRDLGYNIITLLSHKPSSLSVLAKNLRGCFGAYFQQNHHKRWQLIRAEIIYLLLNGLISIQKR